MPPLAPLLPGLPILGNALEFLKEPLDVIERGHKSLGNVFRFRLGNRDVVMGLGPENAQTVFEETDRLLSIREAYPFFTRMFNEQLYFFAEPAGYKEQRELILPCFQGKRMAGYVEVMSREAGRFLDALGASGTFDLNEQIGPLVMNVAAAAFLGEDFRTRMPPEFFELFRDFSGGMELLWPLWVPLPRLRRSARAKEALRKTVLKLIAERQAAPREPADFLQVLAESQFSDELIADLILMLVWAGHETTTGQTSWTLVDLIQHPDWLGEVRAEAEEVIGDAGPRDMEQAKRLKKMEWTVKESERLHPVAYMLLRAAKEELTLGGYHVPKGAMVATSPWFSHRLPEVFSEPQKYDPRRFSPERAEDKQPYSLSGFGGSTHRCAGVNFAYLEMKVVLAMIVQRFELELVNPSPRPMKGAKSKWPESPCRVRYKLREGRTVHAAPSERPIAKASGCPFH
jgi:sterol 14-demethylase